MTAVVGVTYIGNKPQKPDNVGGTGLVWLPGQTHNLPAERAVPFLRYPQVWTVGDADPQAAEQPIEEAKPRVDVQQLRADLTDAMPRLEVMDRAALAQYAVAQFKHHFPANAKEETMRQKILALRKARDLV